MFTQANLLGQILFGAIGMGAFIYGRKQSLPKPLAIGIALMACPFFAPSTWLLYTLGILLTAALFLFRD